MINIIDQIFRNNGFTLMEQLGLDNQSEDVSEKTVLKKIYINKFDEMYFAELSWNQIKRVLFI